MTRELVDMMNDINEELKSTDDETRTKAVQRLSLLGQMALYHKVLEQEERIKKLEQKIETLTTLLDAKE